MSMVVDIHKRRGIRPKYDIYIGRRIQYHKEFTEDSKWRNRSNSLEEYEQWVRDTLWEDLDELKGKMLGCWCITTTLPAYNGYITSCHGQILMKLVEEKEKSE